MLWGCDLVWIEWQPGVYPPSQLGLGSLHTCRQPSIVCYSQNNHSIVSSNDSSYKCMDEERGLAYHHDNPKVVIFYAEHTTRVRYIGKHTVIGYEAEVVELIGYLAVTGHVWRTNTPIGGVCTDRADKTLPASGMGGTF